MCVAKVKVQTINASRMCIHFRQSKDLRGSAKRGPQVFAIPAQRMALTIEADSDGQSRDQAYTRTGEIRWEIEW